MRSYSLSLVLVLVFLILLGTRLVKDGLFVDGITYACIAHNMAHGIGTFWAPEFEPFNGVFRGHPPLAMGIESLFFRVLGSGFWVEKCFCLLIALLTLWRIAAIWRVMFRNQNTLRILWPLPLLLWCVNEDVYLSYTGNMLECTMGLFTLLAVEVALRRASNTAPFYWLTFPILLTAAFLSKGLAALFPLAFLGLHWLVFRTVPLKKIAGWCVVTLFASGVLIGLLFVFEPSKSALLGYFDAQLVTAWQGENTGNLAPHHLYMVQRFFETHTHLIILVLLVWYFGLRRYGRSLSQAHIQWILLWSAVGASAVLPILISPKQAAHYIVPGLPYFALALAIVPAIWLEYLLERMPTTRSRLFSYINVVLCALIAAVLVWCITLWGQPLRRDAARLHDVSVMAPFIGQNQLIGLVVHQSGNSIHGFFMRYYFISLDEINLNRPYIVVEKTMPLPASISNNVELIPIQTQAFDLYRLKR